MVKINMGCGWRNFGTDWIHIDGGNYDHLDYTDITKLEFENNSIDLIYASHVLEYFDRDEAINLLLEWKRVLKKGGEIRLAVPDFSEMARLYVTQNLPLKNILGPLYGKMNMGEKKIYHKTTYDFIELSTLLEKVGLKNIELYDWKNTEHAYYDDHSQAYIPHMDKEKGTLISLNVKCYK